MRCSLNYLLMNGHLNRKQFNRCAWRSAVGISSAGGSAATGTTTGSSTNGTTTVSSTTGGANNNAGSAAAGANRQYNPSGNSLMNTSPSGSTVGPNSSGAGR